MIVDILKTKFELKAMGVYGLANDAPSSFSRFHYAVYATATPTREKKS